MESFFFFEESFWPRGDEGTGQGDDPFVGLQSLVTCLKISYQKIPSLKSDESRLKT
jgi:hypothetical protein